MMPVSPASKSPTPKLVVRTAARAVTGTVKTAITVISPAKVMAASVAAMVMVARAVDLAVTRAGAVGLAGAAAETIELSI